MTYDLQIDRLFATDDVGRYTVSSEMTNNPKKVSGISKLAQIVEKALLTRPGTDVFNQGGGGNLYELLKTSIDSSRKENLVAQVVAAINRVRQDIIKSQSDGNLPLDEQLSNLTLVGTEISPEEGVARVRIKITSKSNIQIVSILP